MIRSLKGVVAEKGTGWLVLEAGGVGYEVHAATATLDRLHPGAEARLLIAESFGMYGGGTTLYGFWDPEERELFDIFREHVPSTGAKKALELLDKAAKSLPDFRRAVIDKDAKMLAGVFGFQKKTAEKLILALKDRLGPASHGPRGARAAHGDPALSQAAAALGALGYRAMETRAALDAVKEELAGRPTPSVEELIKLALKRL